MEFLNNLWIAFSTPNEGLINVVLFVGTFVENFLLMKTFLKITNTNVNFKKKLLYILLISFLSILSRIFIPTPYYLFFNYLVLFITTKYIFKIKILKTFLGTFCFYIIFGLIGFLILNPFLKIANITSYELDNIAIYRIIYLTIIYIIMTLIFLVIKHKKYKLSILDNLDKKNKTIIIISFLLGLITLCLHIFIAFYYVYFTQNGLPILFSSLSFLSLLAYFIISIYTLIKANELFKTTEALHSAEEYNKTLQIIHDSVRCFKHDFDNIVMTIGGYIHTDDIEGLKNYYSNLQSECQSANNLYILNPNVVNDPGIYSLLTNKYYKAEEKNIKLNFSFLLDFNKLNMNTYEFARILGILIDNAIEASNECDEKIVNISFRNEDKNNRQIILIENTYIDSKIDMNKLFDKGVSGKENHTGLGLWEVKKIIKKHNNLNLYTNKNEKYFIQQLELYN